MSKQLTPEYKGKAKTLPLYSNKSKFQKDKIIDALIFIGPAFIMFTIFFIIPLIQGLYYSLTDWNGVGAYKFVGISNYKSLIVEDTNFHKSLIRTFYIAGISIVFTNILAMLFALGLTTKFKANNFLRGMIFLPNMISMAVCGFIWKFMFNKVSGSLYDVTHIGLFNKSMLGDSKNVLIAVAIVALWQGIGYIMTIYVSGILSVDDSLLEAASIDGANAWQSFFKIKLPLMLPMVTAGIFINLSSSLKMFDIVFSLTSGGPGTASEVAMLNVYREAFVYNKFGNGSAKAIILSIIIIIITLIQFRITSGKEVEL